MPEYKVTATDLFKLTEVRMLLELAQERLFCEEFEEIDAEEVSDVVRHAMLIVRDLIERSEG